MYMGKNIRIGLENTLYYRRIEVVQNNLKLVKRMVRRAKEFGREPATVEEIREIFNFILYLSF
ncbi:hypothetical protein LCGC14_1099540 [marine sediment metagenome]|uniref:Uncharacterized protein n=1 Tax=marine sediment metagenome TaxID=412755 RepID=A0A0F9MEF9_9ZZZZ|nr:hypothetical protein [archaeon]